MTVLEDVAAAVKAVVQGEEVDEVMQENPTLNMKHMVQSWGEHIVDHETVNYLKYLKGKQVAEKYGLATDQRYDWYQTRPDGLWTPRTQDESPGHSPESYL